MKQRSRPAAPDLSPAVFALYGEVMRTVQDLEVALANLLGWAGTSGTEPWSVLVDKVIRASKTSMGRVVRELQQVGLPERVAEDLAGVLRDRNHLAHHFFQGPNADMDSVENCKRMLAELTEMELRFHQVTDRVWEQWQAHLGAAVLEGAAVKGKKVPPQPG
jgi:hypothetical protein